MKASLRIGRIAGVEVGVHWSVLFIVVILGASLGAAVLPDGAPGYAGRQYWVAALVAALAFAASILAYELSHAVVANRAGVPVESIVLWLLVASPSFGRMPAPPAASCGSRWQDRR